jgi:hypothetical protein
MHGLTAVVDAGLAALVLTRYRLGLRHALLIAAHAAVAAETGTAIAVVLACPVELLALGLLAAPLAIIVSVTLGAVAAGIADLLAVLPRILVVRDATDPVIPSDVLAAVAFRRAGTVAVYGTLGADAFAALFALG